MNIIFSKYQGAGNDFVIIDNRTKTFPKKTNVIQKLCHRNFGVGADGLILLEKDTTHDFRMIYFNADGNESTMCGNGGRCIVAFAHSLGLFTSETTFIAIDGSHKASINNELVSLQMINVNTINKFENYCFLNTGSPHHVQEVVNLADFNVFSEGRKIRNKVYGSEGSNINFTEQLNDNSFKIRTYERGVENETLACGTGATAVAIAMHKTNKTKASEIDIQTQGGLLTISFDVDNGNYKNVFLKGSATFVFEGKITL